MGDGRGHVRLAAADQTGILGVADTVVVQHPGDGLGGVGIAIQHAGGVEKIALLLVLRQLLIEGWVKDDVELVQLLLRKGLDGGVKLRHVLHRGVSAGKGLDAGRLDDAAGVILELETVACLGGVVAQIGAIGQAPGQLRAAQQMEACGRGPGAQNPLHGKAGVLFAAALRPGGVTVLDPGHADQTALLAVPDPGVADASLDLQNAQQTGAVRQEPVEKGLVAGKFKFLRPVLFLRGEEAQQLLLVGDAVLREGAGRQSEQKNQGQKERQETFLHKKILLCEAENQKKDSTGRGACQRGLPQWQLSLARRRKVGYNQAEERRRGKRQRPAPNAAGKKEASTWQM